MKKTYNTPEIKVTQIIESDVIMLSGLTKSNTNQGTINSITIQF